MVVDQHWHVLAILGNLKQREQEGILYVPKEGEILKRIMA